jgi:uncharacterized protein
LIDVTPFIISLLLAALIGFSAHRANVCTVAAVADVLSSRRGYMFVGFFKTSLWVITITSALMLFVPGLPATNTVWECSGLTLLGGFVFGLGAVLSKGCAFSVLTRLADGQISILLTLSGIFVGAFGYVVLAPTLGLPAARSLASPYLSAGPWLPILAAASLFLAINEAVRLWRTRPANTAVLELFLAERYRLSTAAAIIGLSNGLLYALHGPWAYTRVIQHGAQHLAGSESKGPTVLAMLAMAMFVGMLFSSWQRDNFKLEWRPGFSWFLNVVGGTLRVWVLRRRTAETTR